MRLIIRHRKSNISGFSLAEVLITTFVSVYVLLAAWSVYIISLSWWHEIAPSVEAQRAARIAISSIVCGTADSTAGSDTIGLTSYQRRNGITAAMMDGENIPPTTPLISSDRKRIDFRLETDSSNRRAFYLGTDPATGKTGVYYIDNNSIAHRIDSTLGLTDLRFDYFVDAGGVTHYNIIQVTAKVEKDVMGTRNVPYHIKVEYKDYAYLKNTL